MLTVLDSNLSALQYTYIWFTYQADAFLAPLFSEPQRLQTGFETDNPYVVEQQCYA